MLRLFFGLDAIAVLFVIEELAIPTLRDRKMLPITRWIGRTGYRLLTAGKPRSSLIERSNERLGAAKERLVAAKADLIAAETEQTALRMENKTNHIRIEGDDE